MNPSARRASPGISTQSSRSPWKRKLEQLTRTLYERILNNPWIEWDPHPDTGKRGPSEKQTELLLSGTEEVLYGGAVRGGKTYALMAALVMFHDVPGHSGIIFRKSRDDLFLDDGPFDISVKWGWEDKGSHWNGQKNRYTFPSGKTVTFGYVGQGNSQSYKRYKSSWYQDMFFDQVEELQFKQYDYLRSRLGRLLVHQHIPLRFWSSANPDGNEWVYDHFIKKETRKPGTKFIPATADDNPWVDLEKLDQTLRSMKDPVTVRQLREGIWGLSTAGGMFDPMNFHLVQELPIGQPMVGVRYWDTASTGEYEGGNPAYTAGVRMFRDTSTENIYIDNVIRERWDPLQVKQGLGFYARLDRKLVTDLKVNMLDTWIEQEPGGSGKQIMDDYFRGPLAGMPAWGDKVTGSKEERARPWAAAVAQKRVYLVLGDQEGSGLWIEPFRQEHRRFPTGEFKDQVDAASGAYAKLYEMGRAPAFA